LGFRSTPIILDTPAILALSIAYSCKYAGQSDANPQEKLTIAESKANMQQLLGPKITIAEPRPSEKNW